MPDDRRELGRASGASDREPKEFARAFNTFWLAVFGIALLVFAVQCTARLQWEAVWAWAGWGALLLFILARSRDLLRSQTAWLQGTVLNVEDRSGPRQCDLAAPGKVRCTFSVNMRGDPDFPVLILRDALTGDRLRYVLKAPDGFPLSPDDVRAIVSALERGPAERAARWLRYNAL
ncbi:hypothetical protein F8568_005175 [Actinomadura sp. LD22]|uniref:Uncharacterized protein n=1 Tax=Actinomadura physcomitrii TaxID=2650748 RepID=A0A6I4M1I0_9ACTN|nr:hypothetical protein [Actinomadura physcomitrii]MVZ99777.1 hypothetical protein [Actinomadura physcomitrii]